MHKWEEVDILRRRIDSEVTPHHSAFEGIEWPDSEAETVHWVTSLYTIAQCYAQKWPAFAGEPPLELLPEAYRTVLSEPNAPRGRKLWSMLTDEYGRLQHHHLRLVDRVRMIELIEGNRP